MKLYRVSVKTAMSGWWIVYEGPDRDVAEEVYRIQSKTERTVIERI